MRIILLSIFCVSVLLSEAKPEYGNSGGNWGNNNGRPDSNSGGDWKNNNNNNGRPDSNNGGYYDNNGGNYGNGG